VSVSPSCSSNAAGDILKRNPLIADKRLMSNADELAKLDALRESGVLSQEEFDGEKAKLLAGRVPALAAVGSAPVSPPTAVLQTTSEPLALHATRISNNGAALGLRTCPDCQHEVSEFALACPQCARPFVLGPEFCPYCHKPTAKKVQGVFGSEGLITVVLLCLGIIPGAIYYFDVTRYPYCTTCNRRIRKRVDAHEPEMARSNSANSESSWNQCLVCGLFGVSCSCRGGPTLPIRGRANRKNGL
jgi:hypothetical protein